MAVLPAGPVGPVGPVEASSSLLSAPGLLGKDVSRALISGREVSIWHIWPENREGFLCGE